MAESRATIPSLSDLRRCLLGGPAELHDLAGDDDLPVLEVDVDPRQPDGLASAQAAEGDEVEQGVQPVVGDRVEESSAADTDDGPVAVRRSGGFAGTTRSGELHLGDDPRTPEVQELLRRIEPDRLEGEPGRRTVRVLLWRCGREV